MHSGLSRNLVVDWLRGLAILDMMLVHYSDWLDKADLNSLGKLIRYTDFAVEGFVFVAGFMVGSRYLEKFRAHDILAIKALLRRVAGVICIQYAMIFTISLPMAVMVGSVLTRSDHIWQFAIKSLLFLNQVPLLHILPTFIPLFLLSIPLLYALNRGMDIWVAILSATVFMLGQWYPYLPVPAAENSIFPPLLWQVYFVAGMLVGKHESWSKKFIRRHVVGNLVCAIGVCSVAVFIYHGHHVFPWWENLRTAYGVSVRKFPLNVWGLLYHGSILYLIMALTVVAWGRLRTMALSHAYVGSLGRHSMMLFIGHVYVCFIVNYVFGHVMPVAYSLIAMNLLGSFAVAKILDGRVASPPLSSVTASG